MNCPWFFVRFAERLPRFGGATSSAGKSGSPSSRRRRRAASRAPSIRCCASSSLGGRAASGAPPCSSSRSACSRSEDGSPTSPASSPSLTCTSPPPMSLFIRSGSESASSARWNRQRAAACSPLRRAALCCYLRPPRSRRSRGRGRASVASGKSYSRARSAWGGLSAASATKPSGAFCVIRNACRSLSASPGCQWFAARGKLGGILLCTRGRSSLTFDRINMPAREARAINSATHGWSVEVADVASAP